VLDRARHTVIPSRAVPQVALAQLGARRHYATPVALALHGQLSHLFTDYYVPNARAASAIRDASRWFAPLRRLAGRHAPALRGTAVTSFPTMDLALWYRRGAPRSTCERWMRRGTELCHSVIRHGYHPADAVYAFSSAALELFDDARQRGLMTVLDVATAPYLVEQSLTDEHHRRYPHQVTAVPVDPAGPEYQERQMLEVQRADVVLCASAFVAEAVTATFGNSSPCRIVPLGIALSDRTVAPAPPRPHAGPLRVLFVGDDALRKGLCDLVQALELLGPGVAECRAIGMLQLTESGARWADRHLQRLGRVPRVEMPSHYSWADVVVLPSVSDTFALVVLEAMAASRPVITTTTTGAASALRNGVDGYVLPPNSPDGLAECLRELALDRKRVEAMGDAASEQVAQYSIARYAERLTSILAGAAA
jgi:glycosyltransferase involved in cell wall biosynthesis